MPSILDAERLTLSQAARRLNVHLSTIWRWTLHGVHGRKLPSVQVGGRRYVLRDDLEEFLAAGRDGESQARAGESEMIDRAEHAADELGRIGI